MPARPGLPLRVAAAATQPPATPPGRPLVKPGLVRRTAHAALIRVDAAFSRKGPAFKQLAVSWSANVAGDTLVAVALAGTLFFDVPSAEARDKVALYLLITLAPFAVVAPVLTAVFGRFPGRLPGGADRRRRPCGGCWRW